MPEQERTPLWSAVKEHYEKELYPFHVPGHKGGQGLSPQFSKLLSRLDFTELPGLDNLLSPEGPIKEAEALAANFAGASATYFTTNGSSAGLIAAVLACTRPGSSIALPQNAHISLLNACILGDLMPISIEVELHPEVALPLGYTPESLEKTLSEQKPSLVVATSPTYHGVCSDIQGIAAVCKRQGVPLLVDEAHGTHLLVNPNRPFSAVSLGADIVVQSVHKTGTALTGASWVHCVNPALAQRVKAALQLVQSTSPSYLLLTSLDLARHTLATEGPQLFSRAEVVASQVRSLFSCVSLPGPWLQDPLRIVLDARVYGMTGYHLEKLMHDHGLAPEMADCSTVTLVLGLYDDGVALDVLANLGDKLRPVTANTQKKMLKHMPRCPQVYSPRTVHYVRGEWVPLEGANGRVAAASIIPYPPGIPLIWPGQRFTHESIEYITDISEQGSCVGLCPTGRVFVVAGEVND